MSSFDPTELWSQPAQVQTDVLNLCAQSAGNPRVLTVVITVPITPGHGCGVITPLMPRRNTVMAAEAGIRCSYPGVSNWR